MAEKFQKVALGRTGLKVSRLGLGSSYGPREADIEYAVERGLNYLYWGTRRTSEFGGAIRRLSKRRRSELVVVVQSYSRAGSLMRLSLERALRTLELDHADAL